MNWLIWSLTCSVGKKVLMALTGLVFCVFVAVHLLGNLSIYGGRDYFTAYAEHLHAFGILVNVAEMGLLVFAVLHISLGAILFFENLRARPNRYVMKKSAGGAYHQFHDHALYGPVCSHVCHHSSVHFSFCGTHPSKYFSACCRCIFQTGICNFLCLFHGCYRISCKTWAVERLPDDRCQSPEVYAVYQRGKLDIQSGGWGGLWFYPGIYRVKSVRRSFMQLDSKVPGGPLEEKWDRHRFELKLVNPANKRKFEIIVVGTGLAGASASATLAELGYNVKTFCIQDSPRRAHSIAAQGGINAAKNYQGDGDSIWRLFYDTIKGGDFRAREANVYRLAQISNEIIDQCVAQGVPFAREYGGLLANRSFGGAQVSRTFYARGQTGQQLLLGAYSALMRQVAAGKVKMFPAARDDGSRRHDGQARGIVVRNLITGEMESHAAHAVVLATGGYGNAYFLSTNAMSSNVSAIWRAYKKGAYFAHPSFVQIHPTCIPVHGTISPN